MKQQTPLAFAHIGDLHINEAREQNYTDFLCIASQLAVAFSEGLSFVFLPGDVADHGQAYQYRLVAAGLRMLGIPVHIIGGDHDMEQGSLHNLYKHLQAPQLPYTTVVSGVCCVFLDVCGPGKGGPDFRLGQNQLLWLEWVLAGHTGESVIFMHTYPDDLTDESEKEQLLRLVRQHQVAIVDMGHTHYNEIASDGTTIYAATRSTGQIEEGPVGFSVVSLYNGIVSWRFRHLADALPFVLVTSPADHRLRRQSNPPQDGISEVSALVFGQHGITSVQASVDNGEPVPMQPAGGQFWVAELQIPGGNTEVTVEASDIHNRTGRHAVHLDNNKTTARAIAGDGSDKDSIGAWPENGIFGTQLGPNRNAKPIK